MSDDFQAEIQRLNDEKVSESGYLKGLKKKHKDFLLDITVQERQNVADYICDRLDDAMPAHKELCGRLDKYDSVFRMERESSSEDEEMPNYQPPLSTVACEVMHANIMNVLFTPTDTVRVLPTEEGDIKKIEKLGIFANWSAKNELDLFSACDRMFHSSNKNGETPWSMTWEKEYGVQIDREPIKDPDTGEALVDEDGVLLYREVEKPKLLYNGPKFEPFSRRDYIPAPNSKMGERPDYEFRRIRMSYDEFLREEMQGKMYAGSHKLIKDWSGDTAEVEDDREDSEGEEIPVGKWNKEFYMFCGRMRIKLVKRGDDEEAEDFEILEDEVIAIVEAEDKVLCQLRKNKFPLKERPFELDYLIPDDDGRMKGYGVFEFMSSLQKAYKELFNQYIFAVVESNTPYGFFSPLTTLKKDTIRPKRGTYYPSSDPSGVNTVRPQPPDSSIHIMLELINQWAQLLFGISDYAAGLESSIDPGAPAKKAQLVVAQGNVRMNLIIKRKGETLKKIFRKWFLLYKENMPKNKFMRIAGTGENPWKFEGVDLEDFSLKSIPDFELVGNVLSANKNLEANKRLSIYKVMVANPFFSPQTAKGLQALHSLTKWLMDGMDELGLSRFLPSAPAEFIETPQEENARFLQGEKITPAEQEDHIEHIRVHNEMLEDPSLPEEIKKNVAEHIQETIKILRALLTQQILLQQAEGGNAGFGQGQQATQEGAPGGFFQGQPGGVGGSENGNGRIPQGDDRFSGIAQL